MAGSKVLEEKIVNTRLLRFRNGYFLSFTNSEGLTRGFFRPGELIDVNSGIYPDDFPTLSDMSKLDALSEDDPAFYDEDAPNPTDEDLDRIFGKDK